MHIRIGLTFQPSTENGRSLLDRRSTRRAAAGSGAVCREVSVTTQYVTVTQKSASAASVSKRV